MRFLALLLLAAPAPAGEVLLQEMRAWRGRISIEARAEPAKSAEGSEVQAEEVEFLVVTDPRYTAGARERLQLRLRSSEGKWNLRLDLNEQRGGGDVATRGSGEGSLHFALNGVVDLENRRVLLQTAVKPDRFLARTTLSGMEGKRVATFRTVATRYPFLDGLDVSGELVDDGRAARGERTYVDRHGPYPRTVTLKWSLERLDPVVRGRVVDQNDQAVSGVRVVARTWGSGRMLAREAETDAEGRFAIPAHFASWGVQIVGREDDGIVVAGLVRPDAVALRLDDVPELEFRVTRYRLRALPRPELLAGHFGGNVDKYMEYIAARHDARVLARARVTPATR